MKKILTIFAMLLLLVSVVPFALADNDTLANETEDLVEPVVVDEGLVSDENGVAQKPGVLEEPVVVSFGEVTAEDEAEVAIMKTPEGAQVRLEQLKASIERNVASGEALIAEQNFSEELKLELQLILDDLNSLTDNIDSLDLEQDSNVLAEEYVAIKKQATNLSSEFKAKVHQQIPVENLEQIREAVQERTQAKVQELKQNIEQRKNNYAAKKTENAFQRLGVENPEFIESIKKGEMTGEQVREMVKEELGKLSEEQKKRAEAAFRAEKARQQVVMQKMAEQLKENAQAAYNQRQEQLRDQLQERLNSSDISPELKETIGAKLNDTLGNSIPKVQDSESGKTEVTTE